MEDAGTDSTLPNFEKFAFGPKEVLHNLQLQSNRGNRGLRGSLQPCRQTLPVPPTPTQPMPRRTPSRTSSPPWRTLPRAPRDG